jgi:serine/threonine protein phosphatase PrpC
MTFSLTSLATSLDCDVAMPSFLQQVKDCLEPGMDGRLLDGHEDLFDVFTRVVLNFYQGTLADKEYPQFNPLPHMSLRKADKIDVTRISAFFDRIITLLRKIVGPNIHIQFCRKMAESGCTFGELLLAGKRFRKEWQGVHTIQMAIDLIENFTITECEERSLVPDKKTYVCHDTRHGRVHIKKVALETLTAPIPLQPLPPAPSIKPAIKSKQGIEKAGRLQNVVYCVKTMQGRRPNMQDRHLVQNLTLSDGRNIPLFAVMDGHGSDMVPELLEHFIGPTVTAWINAALHEQEDRKVAIRNAMKIGMIELNHMLKSTYKKTFESVGAVLICSFIFEGDLYTVNVGDCRAVSSSGQQLSLDADHTSQEFVKKITKRGGKVRNRRVETLLPFSVFGDYKIKSLRAFARTHIHPITPGMRVALVTDGITSVFSSQDLIEYLRVGATASFLVKEAFTRGSNDNLSALVFQIEEEKEEGATPATP